MPAPRSGLDNGEVTTSYGFMVPAYPPDPIRSVSALTLPCGICGVAAGDYCRGPRFCASRMATALELMRSGETKDGIPVSPPAGKPGRPKGQDKKLDEQARTDIVRKFKNGMKIASLAREYDVAATSVTYVLDRAGARNS